MDFMHILGQKEIWNTIFSIFERRRGPPNVAGPGKTFPLPPVDGPVITVSAAVRPLVRFTNLLTVTPPRTPQQTNEIIEMLQFADDQHWYISIKHWICCTRALRVRQSCRLPAALHHSCHGNAKTPAGEWTSRTC